MAPSSPPTTRPPIDSAHAPLNPAWPLPTALAAFSCQPMAVLALALAMKHQTGRFAKNHLRLHSPQPQRPGSLLFFSLSHFLFLTFSFSRFSASAACAQRFSVLVGSVGVVGGVSPEPHEVNLNPKPESEHDTSNSKRQHQHAGFTTTKNENEKQKNSVLRERRRGASYSRCFVLTHAAACATCFTSLHPADPSISPDLGGETCLPACLPLNLADFRRSGADS